MTSVARRVAAGGQVGSDGGDAPTGDAHVGDRVEAPLGVDHATAGQDEVEPVVGRREGGFRDGHGSQVRGAAAGCQQPRRPIHTRFTDWGAGRPRTGLGARPAASWTVHLEFRVIPAWGAATGQWRTCKVAIPHMVAAGNGGAIVITNSGAGLKSAPMLGHYVSAKHGLVGLMRTLALELAPHSIRVNSVHPTNVDTEMIHNDAFYELFLPDETERSREKVAELFRQWHPLEIPWVDPVDISNAILFLASDEARYITGVTLPVDGGLMLR